MDNGNKTQLNLDDIEFKEIEIVYQQQAYTVVPITKEIEAKLEPLEKKCQFGGPEAFSSCRKQIEILTGMPVDEMGVDQIIKVKKHIYDHLGSEREKNIKKKD